MKSMDRLDDKIRLIRLHCKVSVTSMGTPLPVIDQRQKDTLDEMLRLSECGLNSNQIAEEMNGTGWKPVSVDRFYGKLVWVSLKKYRKRLNRERTYTIDVTEKSLQKW